MIKIGVIGAGAVSERYHLPGFQQCKGARVKALADINKKKAEELARRFAVESVYADWKEMIQKEELDASMRGVLKAKRSGIPVWKATDLDLDEGRIGLNGSPTQVIKIFTPEPPGKGEMLEGTVPEQAEALVAKLRETKVI